MRVVVAHRGARDLYQTACALEEAGMLEALVTDLYWPADRPWAAAVERMLPSRATRLLHARNERALPGRQTRSCLASGVSSVAATRMKSTPFGWQRAALRWSDDVLGRRAGKLARKRGAALLAYSYYGFSAFSECGENVPKILFQLHPHPLSVRRILSAELERHPECAPTLQREWELALPEQDFARLAAEPHMADHWIAASSFTRDTLVEHGIDAGRVHIVPYGVRPERFQKTGARAQGRLKLLFVGSITQRKGIRYLLEALRLLDTRQVEVTVCGWAVDDLMLFRGFEDVVKVCPSASAVELSEAYASSDLFVFPSLAEGFGHVLLEAMAAGLPVAATTRTAAPDLIRNGDEGFVIEPESASAIAEAIEWALVHRARLRAMGTAARERAREFTWERFRGGIASVVQYAAV
ncbi:MAG TPA: glycosyltransferase family 4 protein [Bryobacteraceae bacterium]|nr:glycosyltransferase family 4 protein [Bryobacteraceae bacterium]